MRLIGHALACAAFAASLLALPISAIGEELPSWNDGTSKQAIVDFVSAVTRKDGPDFVPPADRIAVFDNDGTLWGEQPMYVQLAFAIDRVKALAPQHPEWQHTEPFKSVLAGNTAGVAASGEKGLLEMVAATHAGMTSEEFSQIATDWIATARHPKTGKLYTDMVFQPMLELIRYLKAYDFQVFIVSGGGIEFMRPWTSRVYGIAPAQVVGSSIKATFADQGGPPRILRLPEVNFVDDGAGKPIGIYQHIGQRPIAAFGNSDGDFQMLEWATSGPGRTFGLLVHHDDVAREYAYDRKSAFGRLDRGLAEGPARGWTIVSIKDDWREVYPQ